MFLTLGNGRIWLETPPVVLQFILVFFHFLVGKCLFRKKILTLAKWQNVFNKYVALKHFSFLLGTSVA